MEKKSIWILVAFILFGSHRGDAQVNLVPNADMEQYAVCPSNASISEARQSAPQYWYKPDKGGGGYWNACSPTLNVPFANTMLGLGYQPARSGVGYVGTFYWNNNDSRNYFQVKLKDSLIQGRCYYGEYYVNLANGCKIGSNNQGMLFTKTPVYADTAKYKDIIPAHPQIINAANIITDTVNWVKISGVFTASGGEQYLTLGNFKTNAETVYLAYYAGAEYFGAGYFADDVSVYALDSFPLAADAGRDTSIITGDSVYIGSYTSGLTNLVWYNSSGSVIASGVPGLYVKPTVSTFYVLEQSVCGQYSRDTVFINVGVLPLQFLTYTAIVNTAQTVVHKWVTATEVNVLHHTVERSADGLHFYAIGRRTAANGSYNEYLYLDEHPLLGKSFYRIKTEDKDGSTTYSNTLRVDVNGSREPLSVYPNPAHNSVTVQYPRIKEVIIFNLQGIAVRQHAYNGMDKAVQLNVSNLSSGIYFIRVTDASGHSETQKLIVE